jgi:hypothetical protein
MIWGIMVEDLLLELVGFEKLLDFLFWDLVNLGVCIWVL